MPEPLTIAALAIGAAELASRATEADVGDVEPEETPRGNWSVSSQSYSPLAIKVAGVRDPALARKRTPWGLLLHTTGGGVTSQAKRESKRPIDVAIAVYIASQNGSNGYFWGGPAYVMDHDGRLHQIAPDDAHTEHAGSGNRPHYLDGSWRGKVSAETVAQWRDKWAGKAHPYSLFPSTSPNVNYIGVEMIPIGDGFGGSPMASGLRFTRAQHDAAVALARDVASRHAFPTGWQHTGRLLGHEDVDPIVRSDASGGWDPGFLRARPYFDFAYVRSGI